MQTIETTIPCPDSPAYCETGDCPGCLNGVFEDGVIVFRCNECGQEAGRGAPKDAPVDDEPIHAFFGLSYSNLKVLLDAEGLRQIVASLLEQGKNQLVLQVFDNVLESATEQLTWTSKRAETAEAELVRLRHERLQKDL